MTLQSKTAPAEIRDTLLETYAINDAMNQLLLSHLDLRGWRAQLPGRKPFDASFPDPPAFEQPRLRRWLAGA